jgi:hypothetical protein
VGKQLGNPIHWGLNKCDLFVDGCHSGGCGARALQKSPQKTICEGSGVSSQMRDVKAIAVESHFQLESLYERT